MKLALCALLLAGSASAQCKPDIPDDLKLACVNGEIVIVSESAKQIMQTGIKCVAGRET